MSAEYAFDQKGKMCTPPLAYKCDITMQAQKGCVLCPDVATDISLFGPQEYEAERKREKEASQRPCLYICIIINNLQKSPANSFLIFVLN